MRSPGALLALAVLLVVAACSEGEAIPPGTSTAPAPTVTGSSMVQPTPSTAAPTTSAAAGDPLPPHELDDLAAIFDPVVAPLGYEVTRGSLIVRSTYVVDPEGDHLALYLAPFADLSDDEYAADLPLIAAALIPMVFERWPALVSFDVCQEPFGASEQTPPSLTIVDLDRTAAGSVEWEGIDLAGLIEAGRSVDGITVWARTGVRDSTTWTDAAGD